MPDARLAAKLKEEAFRAAAAARGEAPEPLFKGKLSKEEKKAAAEAKRAELAAKKAARKTEEGAGGGGEGAEVAEATPADIDGLATADDCSLAEPEEDEAAETADEVVCGDKLVGGAARKAAKAAIAAKAAEVESITAGATALSLSDGQEQVAASRAVTGVLASAAKAWDVKFASFSLAVGGNQLVADCDIELTQASTF
jgi:hypothetical protein